MPDRIAFTVPGKPQAWQRAGVRVLPGGHAQHYTKAETASYESLVKHRGEIAMAGRPPFEGPLTCRILIRKDPPKSASLKKRADMLVGKIHPTMTPDCSNIAKGVEDALNTIVYRDDSQIVNLHVAKRYAETAGVDVLIERVT
jgi:Holliday junction resolvase RusA-like endonuclease